MATIKLQSSDGVVFDVDFEIIKASITIETMLKASRTDGKESVVIPIYQVNSTILQKILVWLEHHKNDPPPTDEPLRLKQHKLLGTQWDRDFFKIDQNFLYELTLAARDFEIKDLYDSACLSVANLIRGKTSEQIREIMGIKPDNGPEEENMN